MLKPVLEFHRVVNISRNFGVKILDEMDEAEEEIIANIPI